MNKKLQTKEEELELIEKQREELLDVYRRSKHSGNTKLINEAFDFALKAHDGQRRKSGEAYIFHPIAVARIVAEEIGLGSTTIAAALLHDVVEDCEYSVDDIKRYFGADIASIVDGVTKISGGIFGEKANKNSSAQAENFRKLLIMMSYDIRILLIKLADRLHNMRTLGSMPPAKQSKIVGETEYIYSLLASRLGFYKIKTEMEDLCLKYDHSDSYIEINDKLEKMRDKLDERYESFIYPIEEKLRANGIKYEIQKRIKSPYSIWKKMSNQNINFNKIRDIMAVRIIFELDESSSEKVICWKIYGLLNEIYRINARRTRNWLDKPKENGYEALHVTIYSGPFEEVEVQIRSQRMHQIAERGVAAHWKYKESTEKKQSGYDMDDELDQWLSRIKKALEDPDADTASVIEEIIESMSKSKITVFTPKAELIEMNKGATVLDFAFHLHTEMGYRAIAAEVNKKMVNLDHVLENGDSIKIITSDKSNPKKEWEDILTTQYAKNKLKKYFKNKETDAINKGKRDLEEILEKNGRNADVINRLLSVLGLSTRTELHLLIGEGSITEEEITRILEEKEGDVSKDKIKAGNTYKLNELKLDQTFKRASCCHPIPGDDIIGYVDRDDVIVVHRKDCDKALKIKSLEGHRLTHVEWIGQLNNTYNEMIEVEGINKKGIVNEILEVISKKSNVDISDISVKLVGELFSGRFVVLVHTQKELNTLMEDILKVSGVTTVKRGK